MSRMAPGSARTISTTSQVHPAYLPALHKSGRLEKKVALAAVAAVGIGYGVSKYREMSAERQQQNFEAAQRRRNEAMMEAYGDRDSLDSLEAAVRAYETQRETR